MATTGGQAQVTSSSYDGGSAVNFFKSQGLGPRGSSLARQQSIYSLTLDEFQNALGHEQAKNFGSMNMSEFLENIWSAEEGVAKETGGGLVRQASLHKQGSINLPGTLTGKTVDEVWRDIHQNSHKPAAAVQKQNTFGEMTLEDFLRKAGVVGDELDLATGGALSSLGVSAHPQSVEAQAQKHQAEWMDYQMKQQQKQQLNQFMGQQGGPSMLGHVVRPPPLALKDIPDRKPQLSHSDDFSSLDEKGDLGGLTPSSMGGMGNSPRRGKKRPLPAFDAQGKTVERKVKRMIKNRESAARSRARKQAYTQDLEEKIAKLKEENAILRKQLAGEVAPQEEPVLPKLRRTRTS